MVQKGADLLGGGDEPTRLRSVTDDLIKRFDRSVRPIPAHVVEAEMNEAVSRYADARIRDFVPVLAEKDARSVLRQKVLDESLKQHSVTTSARHRRRGARKRHTSLERRPSSHVLRRDGARRAEP
jgi:hypothetical protein